HDAANLFDVAYAFGYVAQQYKNNVNRFGYKMQQKLEKRYAKWEQPLLLLAIIFHPQYLINQKDIGKVALRLYSIKINSAPCKCLFSRMGWFHNPKRTHLKLQTIFRMTQVVAEMAWEDHLNNTKEVRKTVIANHITSSNDTEHQESKIKLRYFFTYTLSQPLFVRTLQQDVEVSANN
ncbi:16614_t:CDS:2, partial [Dentiscutata erythropus]